MANGEWSMVNGESPAIFLLLNYNTNSSSTISVINYQFSFSPFTIDHSPLSVFIFTIHHSPFTIALLKRFPQKLLHVVPRLLVGGFIVLDGHTEFFTRCSGIRIRKSMSSSFVNFKSISCFDCI